MQDKKALLADIADMKKVINDPDTPKETKDVLSDAVQEAESQLAAMEASEKKVEKKEVAAKQDVVKKERKLKTAPVAQKPVVKKQLATAQAKVQRVAKEKKAVEVKQNVVVKKIRKKVTGILAKVPAPVAKFNAGKTEDELQRDADRKAKKPGKRLTEWGTVYYENRSNRADISRRKRPYLEDGGVLAHLKVQLFNVKKEYSKDDHVAYKDEAGEFTKAGTITGIRKDSDGIRTYVINDGVSYTADELRPLIYPEGDTYVDENGATVSAHDIATGPAASYAFGGRLLSAINRDRAYKSQEPHEQGYQRKTRPKNPKYKYAEGGVVLHKVHPQLAVEPFIPYYESMGYTVRQNVLPDGWVELIGSKSIASMNPMEREGENLNVFGYQTQHFDVCPTAGEEYRKAISILEGEREAESVYWRNQTEALAKSAQLADAILGVRKVNAGIKTEFTIDLIVKNLMMFGIYNYKTGLKIKPDFLSYHVGMIIAEMSDYESLTGMSAKMAAGGITAGRWYKTKGGQELRFVGSANNALGIFIDANQKYINVPFDELEVKPERKLFGIFEEGGPLTSQVQQLIVYAYPVAQKIARDNGLAITPSFTLGADGLRGYTVSDGGIMGYISDAMWETEDGKIVKIGLTYHDTKGDKVGEIVIDMEANTVSFDFPMWEVSATEDINNPEKMGLGAIVGNPNNPEWDAAGAWFEAGGELIGSGAEVEVGEVMPGGGQYAAGGGVASFEDMTPDSGGHPMPGAGNFAEGGKLSDRQIVDGAKQYNTEFQGRVLGYPSTWNTSTIDGSPVIVFSYYDDDFSNRFNVAAGIIKDGTVVNASNVSDAIFDHEVDALRFAKEWAEDENFMSEDNFAKGGVIERKREEGRYKLYIDGKLVQSHTFADHDHIINHYDKLIKKTKGVSKFEQDGLVTFYGKNLDKVSNEVSNIGDVEDFAAGGTIRKPNEISKLKADVSAQVDKMSDKELVEAWNEKSGSSNHWTEAEIKNKRDYHKKYVRDLLFETQLSEAEYNKYFEAGGVTIDPIPVVDEVAGQGGAGVYAKGGRILSAVKRDRKYKSQEPHEQSYKRVRNPKNPAYKKKAFEAGGEVVPVIKESFATGGIVKTIPEGEEYRYKGSNFIEKDIHDKIREQIANLKFAGNYYVYGQKNDAYLYELDETDKEYVSSRNQGKIKDDERVFRYYTRTTAIGGMVPLVKINIVKGLLYYPIYDGDDRELINFETKGVRPEYLNLVKGVSSFDHGGSVDEDHFAHAKQVGRESQDFTAEAKEYAGAEWNKMSETEKQALISEMQKDWDKGNRFAKGGSTSKEKRFAVYLSTEVHGENYDDPNYETDDYEKAIAWAKKKSAQSHPDEPKNFGYSDYYYAADVFDRVASKIVAQFYRGEADDFEKPEKVVDAKYYEKKEKKTLSDFFGERDIATFYSEKSGPTNDMMKVVADNNPNADMEEVKSFIGKQIYADWLNEEDEELEFMKAHADETYVPQKQITYQDGLIKLKEHSAGKSFATQKAMQEALKLWFKKPVKGIEIKDVHFAKGGTVKLPYEKLIGDYFSKAGRVLRITKLNKISADNVQLSYDLGKDNSLEATISATENELNDLVKGKAVKIDGTEFKLLPPTKKARTKKKAK